uniref:Uncharacterized protein n=1 Tax=Noctiluca scintillans TaxID=2966 RepID=A0A7S1AZ20_NOCSC|mmetsp:Transcript_65670/g.173968  ORF Transcript_65670/g.173968 Transcript_65670/m.173968 type:complete len:323 (+) Transcript_65670:60-1028(+)
MGCGLSVKANDSCKLFETEDSIKEDNLTVDKLPWALPKRFKFGFFSVNDEKIKVEKIHTLQTLFDIIEMESGVKVRYDFEIDRLILEGTNELKLGAKGDTSNFLKLGGLKSNGQNVVKSKFPIGKNPGEPVDDMDMEEIDVAYFDDAFSKAAGPLGTTIELRTNISDGRQGAKDALEIPPGVKTIKEGLVALKKDVETLRFEFVPSVQGFQAKFTGAETCQSKIEAVMTFIEAVQGAMEALPQLTEDVNDLVEEVKTKVTEPSQITDALKEANVPPMAWPGKINLVWENVQKLTKAPAVISDMKNELDSAIGDLKGAAEALQ